MPLKPNHILRAATALTGAALGGWLGASTGVSAAGTGFNGIWLFTPLGALMGYLASFLIRPRQKRPQPSASTKAKATGMLSEKDLANRLSQKIANTPAPDKDIAVDLFALSHARQLTRTTPRALLDHMSDPKPTEAELDRALRLARASPLRP